MSKPKNLPDRLTDGSIEMLEAADKRYDVKDNKVVGLYITVYPTGKKSWVFRYRAGRKSRRFVIGDSSVSPAQARKKAKSLAGEVANGGDPSGDKKKAQVAAKRAATSKLGAFIDNRYGPWVVVERKSGEATLSTLKSSFAFLLERQIEDISTWDIERWRRERHKKGTSPSTTNRQIAALRACISKALDWGLIDEHPLRNLKPSRVDKSPLVRTISDEEEESLRSALRRRDRQLREQRKSGNEWRAARHQELLPELDYYADHLEPMVLVALNTGMRRGEILHLRWSDLTEDSITVRGTTAKSSQTRVIPMNAEVKRVFERWSANSEWVFPGRDTSPLTTVKKSWGGIKKDAGLPNLRFHDLRHTFATRVLQRGNDIKTVQDLLGHADVTTTTKYLHATDDTKRKAVESL